MSSAMYAYRPPSDLGNRGIEKSIGGRYATGCFILHPNHRMEGGETDQKVSRKNNTQKSKCSSQNLNAKQGRLETHLSSVYRLP